MMCFAPIEERAYFPNQVTVVGYHQTSNRCARVRTIVRTSWSILSQVSFRRLAHVAGRGVHRRSADAQVVAHGAHGSLVVSNEPGTAW
jgi:hypothetical protein